MPQPAYPMSGCVAAGAPGNVVIYSSTVKSYEAQPLQRTRTYRLNGATERKSGMSQENSKSTWQLMAY